MEAEMKGKSSKTEAFRQLPEKNLHLLLDTIESMNQTMELKSALVESMEATRIVMNSEASSLLLLDKDTGELFVSLPTGPVKEEVKGKSIPGGKGIGGWVANERKPYISNDVENSDIFWGDLAKNFKTKNIICVPLINRENKVIGVLQALNKRRDDRFTPHDIPVLQALASHITVAIERTRYIDTLNRRIQEKETRLAEIHHRTRTNLQALSDIIDREIPNVSDQTAEDVLKDTYNRLQTMKELHELLFDRKLINGVDLGKYLSQLTDKMEKTISAIVMDAKINLNSIQVEVTSNQALLCGLILNELMMNIYKHSFPTADDHGHARINVQENAGKISVEVMDDGTSLPDNFEIDKRFSIGMLIITDLLKKLDGGIDILSKEGVYIRLSFQS